ncbi:MAG: YciI family protein [Proteobacteria bacterium]|nr:YciI family protein [Pseudomonadota bacterium]MBU1688269.1 YciI family protein [Pseudomonadota bacterium]
MSTYVFIYFMVDDVETVKRHLGAHVKYWKSLKLDSLRNGPFTDKSGGLIMFNAASPQIARERIELDPFVTEKVLKEYWLKEWVS